MDNLHELAVGHGDELTQYLQLGQALDPVVAVATPHVDLTCGDLHDRPPAVVLPLRGVCG